MRKYGMVILKYQSIDARISVLNIDTLISMFASQLADFLYPPPPLYPPPNTMVILGSPRIPRRGMHVARSVAQRSDALREIGPPRLADFLYPPPKDTGEAVDTGNPQVGGGQFRVARRSAALRSALRAFPFGECEGTLILPSC